MQLSGIWSIFENHQQEWGGVMRVDHERYYLIIEIPFFDIIYRYHRDTMWRKLPFETSPRSNVTAHLLCHLTYHLSQQWAKNMPQVRMVDDLVCVCLSIVDNFSQPKKKPPLIYEVIVPLGCPPNMLAPLQVFKNISPGSLSKWDSAWPKGPDFQTESLITQQPW